MKNFMSNLLGKLPKLGLAIFAWALGVLTFINGILIISGGLTITGALGGGSSTGSFVNCLIMTGFFALLGFEIFKGNKEKAGILSLLIIADSVLVGLGSSIDTFSFAGEFADYEMGGLVASSIFMGIGLLCLFVASVCLLIPSFIEKADKGLFNLIASIALFATAVFIFIATIIELTQLGEWGGEGIDGATTFFGGLIAAGEAVFLAFDSSTYHPITVDLQKTLLNNQF